MSYFNSDTLVHWGPRNLNVLDHIIQVNHKVWAPDPEPTVISTSPAPEISRQIEPTGVSEQALWRCSYRLQTPEKSNCGLNILKEENNVREMQGKPLQTFPYLLGVIF